MFQLVRLSFFALALCLGTKASACGTAKENSLVGTWELVSFVVIDKEGKETEWCKGVHGLLTYTSEGYMSAAINCAKDTTVSSPSKKYNDMLVYAGTYDLHDDAILHNVTNASDIAFMGERAVRHVAKLTDSTLILTGDFGGSFKISWRKAKRHSIATAQG